MKALHELRSSLPTRDELIAEMKDLLQPISTLAADSARHAEPVKKLIRHTNVHYDREGDGLLDSMNSN